MQDIIHETVFQQFPTFKRAIVHVKNARISNHNPQLAELLEAAQADLQARQADLTGNSRLEIWKETHRAFGSNPNRFPPSILSLINRVLRGNPLPYVNDAVALFNAISLKYLVPCGGDDLARVTGDLQLGIADGSERFIPLGTTEVEHPVPGEVIYFDSSLNVMCRRWNWRNGDFTKITTETRDLLINVDGIGSDIEPVITEAAEAISEWLEKACGATTRRDLLSIHNRAFDLI